MDIPPYVAPGVAPSGSQGMWRDGSAIVVSSHAPPTECCIYCGRPAAGGIGRRSVGVPLSMFGTWVPVLPVCDIVVQTRRRASAASFGVVALFVVVLVMSRNSTAPLLENFPFSPVILVMLAIGGLAAWLTRMPTGHRRLRLVHRDGDFLWIEGAQPNWVATLPALQPQADVNRRR